MSVAAEPLTMRKTVPSELLKTEGGLSVDALMFMASAGLITLSTLGYFLWGWAGWCVFLMNVLSLHLAGTVIHDASHNSAHRHRLVNAVLGHGSALILGFSFPVFTRVHLQHHAHVNDPDNDPDHFVSTGGPLWLIAARFFYHEIYFFKRQLWRNWELLEWFLGRFAVAALVFTAWKFDFLGYIFNFWFSPALVVGIALGLFFDYLPHRPFQERDRWKNARVYPGAILNILIMGQNYHLVHHLWPSVPWYKYKSTYEVMQPLLDSKGSPQSLGLLQVKDFSHFLYDLFLGIRLKGH
ncbi:MAG: fatty acid desaturase [Cyanobacteria bacterium REEB459]|nr:fatty acid desaturase [Cyanobacteria bacterium REEB459]